MVDATVIPELSDAIVDGYALLDSDAGHVDITGQVALFELSGEDRKAWLNGQVTNELRSFLPGSSADFCLCSPTGQILAMNRGGAFGEFMWVTCDHKSAAAWNSRFESAIIMEDVRAVEVTSEYQVITVQGPQATRKLGELVELPALDAGVTTLGKAEIRLLRSNRTPYGGWDIFVPKGQKTAVKKLLEVFPVVPSLSLAISSLEAGHPMFGVDTDSKTMPPELGTAFEARNVSYNKGCYTGQEVLMRLHSRGHTNKTWVALQAEQPIKAGDKLIHLGKNEVGQVTRAYESPRYGFIAGAMVRNQAAFDDEVTTIERPASGAFEAVIRHFPILRFD